MEKLYEVSGYEFVDKEGDKDVQYKRIKYKNRYNYIDEKTNKLLSSIWFIQASKFNGKTACVQRDDSRWNLLNTEGKFVCKDWYINMRRFCCGYVGVQLEDKKWNFINEDGEYISKEWYMDLVDFDFKKGRALVKIPAGIWRLIDTSGNFVKA